MLNSLDNPKELLHLINKCLKLKDIIRNNLDKL